MAFVQIDKGSGGGRSCTNVVRVWQMGKGANQRVLRFAISKDIAEQLHFATGARFDLLAGSGEDAGKIAVRLSDSLSARKFVRIKASRHVHFNLSATTLGAVIPEHTTTLPHSVRDGMLLIDIRPILSQPLAAVA